MVCRQPGSKSIVHSPPLDLPLSDQNAFSGGGHENKYAGQKQPSVLLSPATSPPSMDGVAEARHFSVISTLRFGKRGRRDGGRRD